MRFDKLLVITMIALFVFSYESNADHKADSLLLLIKSAHGTEKVDLYNQLTRHFLQSVPTRAPEFARKAIALAKELNYSGGRSYATYLLGACYSNEGNSQAALQHYKESLKYYQVADDPLGQFKALNGIGNQAKRLGNNEEALEYYNQALAICEENGFDQYTPIVYNNIGIILKNRGELAGALDYYFKALKMDQEIGDQLGIKSDFINIGNVYKNLKQMDLSVDYYTKALDIDQYNYLNGNIYSSLASIRNGQGRYDEALELGKSSLKAFAANGQETGVAYANHELALIFVKHHLLDSASIYYERALKNYLENKNKMKTADVYENMGYLAYLRKNDHEAIKFLEESLTLAFKLNLPVVIRAASNTLTLVHERLGNHQEALKYFRLYKDYSDSLRNEDQTRRISRLEAEFEFSQEKDSIQFANDRMLLAKNSEIQLGRLRTSIVVVIGLSLLVLVFVVARMRLNQKAQQTEQLKEMSEFKEAMTGMIAHDLKNPLGVILGSESEKTTTRGMARQMLNLVNNMLDVHKFESTEVSLNESNVKLKFLFEKAIDQVINLLTEKNIQVESSIDESMNVRVDEEYMLRVFVNLLTNAIKYSPNNGVIKVGAVEVDGERVQVSLIDYGAGIPKEAVDKIFNSFERVDPRTSGLIGSTGLGLSFCQLALRAHGSDIKVHSKLGEGSRFTFSLPLSVKNVEGADPSESIELAFTMNESERQYVLQHLPQLRSLKIHEAFEIEQTLANIKAQNSKKVDDWAEAVLNAAYTNNKVYFDELLDVIGDRTSIQES